MIFSGAAPLGAALSRQVTNLSRVLTLSLTEIIKVLQRLLSKRNGDRSVDILQGILGV
jgi:hypothetical protein